MIVAHIIDVLAHGVDAHDIGDVAPDVIEQILVQGFHQDHAVHRFLEEGSQAAPVVQFSTGLDKENDASFFLEAFFDAG